MEKIVHVLLFVSCISACYGLSCLPCGEINCEPVSCKTRVVKDVCGCCDVCSKDLGEKCGGPWDITGICDDGLICHKTVRPGDLAFNYEGVCQKNTSRRCPYPTVLSECASACQPRCDERTAAFCTLQCIVDDCVCMEGFIRRSATNRTCVPVDECPPKECEFPKIFSRCATACPKTCGNPFPFRCTKNCDLDPCICPEGFIMRSLTDRTCIRDYECEDFSFCRKDCTSMIIGASPCDKTKIEVCELNNWKCNAYEWKMEMAKWWEGNGCEMENGKRLWEMYDEITDDCQPGFSCQNQNATVCTPDGFGCMSCTCTDGKFADLNELTWAHSRNRIRYRSLLMFYKMAVEKCRAAPTC